MRNLPKDCPEKVSLVLSDGSRIFDTSEALTIIGQNLTQLSHTGKGQTRIGQTIPCSFGNKDPYSACPFYMAGFFMGLEMGKNIPGIIPLDGRDSCGKTLAGEMVVKQPLFGAPVAGLSCDMVRAVPINLGAAMGQKEADTFLSGIMNRNLESYPPMASEECLTHLMSRWGDLEPLGKTSLDDDKHWILSSAEAFSCADTLRAAAEHTTRLAREFNSLQDKNCKSDGIKMLVKQHMLSVVTHFHVPLPVREKWDLSCAKNMRLAVEAMSIESNNLCLVKSQFRL